MGQAAQIYSLGGEIYGAELDMGFQEEAVGIELQFEHIRQLPVAAGCADSRAQDDIIGLNFNNIINIRAIDRNQETVCERQPVVFLRYI